MLAKSVHEKDSAEVIAIERANGENSGVEGVNFFYDVTHRSARAEAGVECLGDECHLGVGAKVFMTLAEGAKDRCRSIEVGDDLVVSARDVLEHECFERSIVSLPSTVAPGIDGDVRLREGAIEPVCEPMAIGDQRHLKAPFFPV